MGVSSNYLVTYLSLEKRVFCTVRAVFKIFFSFPSNFMWLFTFSLNCSYPNTSCHSLRTPLLLHFFSKSSRKGMGLLFLTSYVLFWVFFSCRLSCYWTLCSNILLLDCWVWRVVFDADFIRFHSIGLIVFFFVLFSGCCWISYPFGLWVWYFFCFNPFVCVSAYVCQRHWITYLILLCFYVVITCVCFYLECITLIHSIFQFVMSLCHLLLFGCMWFSVCISDPW